MTKGVLRRLFWLVLALPLVGAGQQSGNISKGLEAFKQKDFAKAEEYFGAATRESPGSALAHKLLGMSFAAHGDYGRAFEPFRKACELNPAEDNACYYVGRTLYSLSRFEESRAAFELALKYQKPPGRVLLGLALTQEALGAADEAERLYKAAIDAGESRALIDYGLFLHKGGRSREAIEVLRKSAGTAELERVLRESAAARRPAGPVAAANAVKFDIVPLPMTVSNGAAGNKHLIETMIAGVALLDYDDDGRLDIFVSNGAEIPTLAKSGERYWNRLFRNLGGDRFEDVTLAAGLAGAGYCMGAAAADYDNDGRTDLFVTGVRGNHLYRNLGNGKFADATSQAGVGGDGTWSVAAGWFDFDSDGWLDLLAVHYVEWDPAAERVCGRGESGYRSYCHPRYYRPLPNALYRNLGNGTFREVSVESGIAAHRGKGMGLAIGDVDADGHLDVFVSNDTAPNFLFHNDGNGRFTEKALESGVAYNGYGTPVSSMGADFRDVDNDGLEDLFVTALTNETFPLFRNQGDGLFVDIGAPARLAGPSLPWSGWSLGVFDLNNDGWKDLFTANGHAVDNIDMMSDRKARQPNTVFLNRGDGTFRIATLPGEALHRGCAFGDLNGDGRIDAVVTRLNDAPLVLLNTTEGTGNWIRFRLRGTRSNRDGLGALIRIETETGRQWNRATTCVGYGGSSEPAVHFGLGAATRVVKAVIRWPSGVVQELKNLEANRIHDVMEPDIKK